MRKRLSFITVTYLLATFISMVPVDVSALSGSSFRPGRIIDDSIFFDGNSMAAQDIQKFLESKVPVCDTNGQQPYNGTTRAAYGTSRGNPPPYTCLRDYMLNVPAMSADQYCTGTVSAGWKIAAQAISDVARACSISPKVLIVLLQKEQSLIADDWPWPIQYTAATGYACPDTASCDPEFAGLFNQMYYAARQYQRYAKLPTQFSYASGRNNFIKWHPDFWNSSTNSWEDRCGGSNVFIENQATAGLYNYTPYQPNASALNNLYGSGDGCGAYGNRNFWRLYTDWFGSTVTGVCYNGDPAAKTDVQFHTSGNERRQYADFVIYSGTGSGCVESHVWNSGFNSWKSHTASNQPGVNAADNLILFGDLEGNNRDYPLLFGVKNTSTGLIESHVWDRSMASYLAHAASNQPLVNMSDNKIILGDLNGDGRDEPIIVSYQNTGSGTVEFHGWGNGMQGWLYHIATNMTAVNPIKNTIQIADTDGDGRDEAILVSLSDTGSGRIEFHTWNPGQYSWKSHVASNMPTVNPANTKVEFADTDGDGRDEAVLVGLRGTGSSMVEFHVWNQGFTSWRSNNASNQPSPTQ